MIDPRSDAEAAAFELWKRLQPNDAYFAGLDACTGAFFVPTQATIPAGF